ncbi:MAG: CBS domain-containing protein [Alphaproteobacteria bacterium]|nr:CBS domain-containing protein [Alphaproteobacteria bacterium]
MRFSEKTRNAYADTVGDIVSNRSVVTFTPLMPVGELVRRLHDAESGAGVVLEPDGRMAGLVTEREIIRRVFRVPPSAASLCDEEAIREHATCMTARNVMIENPEHLFHDEPVENAVEKITAHGFRFMPVLGRDDKLTGIVEARELGHHARLKMHAIMEHQKGLLTNFMAHEPYGGAGGYAAVGTKV